jgi:hypothetical protein
MQIFFQLRSKIKLKKVFTIVHSFLYAYVEPPFQPGVCFLVAVLFLFQMMEEARIHFSWFPAESSIAFKRPM